MKRPFIMLIAIVTFALSSLQVQAGATKTNVTGNYSGSLETKSFTESSSKMNSRTNIDIDLMFNGDVFIYQAGKNKCMGKYVLEDGMIVFTINTIKGDAELMKSIFNSNFKYSKSGKSLMLISDKAESGDIYIYKLTKRNI